MGSQTYDTFDAVQKSYLFENATKETIPPFAAMQLVTDPSKWRKELLTREAYNDWTLSAEKVGNAQFVIFEGNKVILFCDKPSVYSEFAMDPGQIAFNGPSPVGPRKRGKCFYGVYPVKALAPGTAISGMVVRNSWLLWPGTAVNFNIGGGCFSSIGTTGQAVKFDGSELEAPSRVALVVLNPKPDLPSLSASGTFGVTGKTIGKPPAKMSVTTSTYAGATGSYPYSRSDFAYGSDPSLTLNIPGLYTFTYSGRIVAASAPSSLIRLDYNVAPTTWDLGGNTWKSLIYIGGADQNYLTTTVLNVPPLQQILSTGSVWNGETLATGVTKAWNSISFVMRDRIQVTKTPVVIGIQQTSSPYVNVTDGTFHASYDYESGWRGYIRDRFAFPLYDGVGVFDSQGYWNQWRRKVTVRSPSGAEIAYFS